MHNQITIKTTSVMETCAFINKWGIVVSDNVDYSHHHLVNTGSRTSKKDIKASIYESWVYNMSVDNCNVGTISFYRNDNDSDYDCTITLTDKNLYERLNSWYSLKIDCTKILSKYEKKLY